MNVLSITTSGELGRLVSKKFFLITAFIFLSFIVTFGQAPTGYYTSADGKSGNDLKAALYEIINGHTEISYTGLWTAFQYTDKKSNGKVWDMYSDIPSGTPPYEFTFTTDQCGNYSGEGDCYNREHSFPKSWFSDATPMYSDLFHLYPTDGYVNGKRSNYPFGEVSSPEWTSLNGSKLGTCSYPGYSGKVFEPIDEYKGDFARSYFYMVTRYHDVVSGWSTDMLDGSQFPAFTEWAINMLLEWHEQDAVSQKEIDRNNEIYNNYQHNRNPFIDNPDYAQQIWGDGSVSVSFSSTPSTTVQAGTSYTYSINVTGESGATFTITSPTKPSWLTLTSTGNGTATLSGTPAEENVGANSVVLNVTDGTTSKDQSFTITVSSSIVPLQFTSTPTTSGQVDVAYSYNVTVIGNSGSTFTLSAPTKPSWLTLTSTGNGTATLSGTPAAANVGSNSVVLNAGDGTSTTEQSFTINVTETSSGESFIETFENMPASSSSYSSRSWTGDNSITWSATLARTDQTINTRAICLGNSGTPTLESQTISGGCGMVKFDHQQKFTGSGGVITLYVNDVAIGTADVTADVQTSTFTLNESGDFVIKLVSNAAARIAIDDLEWQQQSAATNQLPQITAVSTTPAIPVTGQTISVSSTIVDTDGTIVKVLLGWGTTAEATENTAEMTADGNIFTATIPAQTATGTLYYKISAIDNSVDTAYYFQSTSINTNELPEIASIVQDPINPTSQNDVVITADVSDPEGRLSIVYLNWGLAEGTLNNQLTMTNSSSTYTSTIPAQDGGQTIYYKITAIDSENNQSESVVQNYTVIVVNELPVISAVIIEPTNPVTGQSINVSTSIIDNDGTILKAILSWGTSADAADNFAEMIADANTFTSEIPVQTLAQLIYFKISAIDNSEDTSFFSQSINIETNQQPVISNINQNPSNPTSTSDVVVSANVSDPEGRLSTVKLYWGLASDNLNNQLTMSNVSSAYTGTIPAQAGEQTVYYHIIAKDSEDYTSQSDVLSYNIVTSTGNNLPIISSIVVNPLNPVTGQSIVISSNIVDTDGSVVKVLLSWGTTVLVTDNTFEVAADGDNYSYTIPAQSQSGMLYFKISAIDDLEDTTYYASSIFVGINNLPEISSISHSPINPKTTENVTITANIVDLEERLSLVQLMWGLTESTLSNEITMEGLISTYTAVIPSQAEGQSVYYKIIAKDEENNQSESSINIYTVQLENDLPLIGSVIVDPASPLIGESINISANITDTDGEILKATLNWGLSSDILDNFLEMTADGDNYSTTIPAQTESGTIYFKVSAIDNSEDTSYYFQSFTILANQPPVISNVDQSPLNPTSTDNVIVSAQVVDPENSIGNVYIQWGYAENTLNYQILTTSSTSTFSGSIPAKETGTIVYYRIKAYDSEGNQGYSSIFNYTVSPASAIEESKLGLVKAFPNPFREMLYIENENLGNSKIAIMDIIGNVIFQSEFSDKSVTINTNHLKAGIYIIKVINNSKTTVLRVVKR